MQTFTCHLLEHLVKNKNLTHSHELKNDFYLSFKGGFTFALLVRIFKDINIYINMALWLYWKLTFYFRWPCALSN